MQREYRRVQAQDAEGDDSRTMSRDTLQHFMFANESMIHRPTNSQLH